MLLHSDSKMGASIKDKRFLRNWNMEILYFKREEGMLSDTNITKTNNIERISFSTNKREKKPTREIYVFAFQKTTKASYSIEKVATIVCL